MTSRRLKTLNRYCKEYWKIENYDKAERDNFEGWVIHHRLQISITGEEVHTAESLKRLNMYYNRPYFELIFLTANEHRALHNRSKSPWNKGKHLSDKLKERISKSKKHCIPWNKGKKLK